ncbi:hypothetical protein [Agrilutibacter solisilvae]|uniref:Uncharacterized protein n=1 Tax=Agrilutibacter solisilvae TaxID=2763317 RepID=A0A974Y5B3_9GAMM|nr:hypothetical protein [Lysobacter solisilvae]QSX78586.1 hypothetical protein I8J32_001155 [Lysobacter solisilvae]
MSRAGIERWVYVLEAVAFGLPALLVAVPGVILGSMLGWVSLADLPQTPGPTFFVWLMVVAGGGGIASWCVLSGTYVVQGHGALRLTPLHWWLGLLAGMAVALVFLAPLVDPSAASRWMGTPALLLLPSLHLLWLKFRK